MSDTTQAAAETVVDEAPATGPRFKIKVAKAGQDVEIIWNELSDEVKMHIIEHGFSKVLNAATAKVTKTTQPDAEKLKAEAYNLAMKKLDALKRGEVGRKKASKGPGGKVMTEARRLAKIIVKAAIKEQGGKISDYEAKEITEAANQYIEENPQIVADAEASIKRAEALAGKGTIDTKKIPVSAKKVAAREAKNAEARKGTADKAAGKPGPQASTLATRGKVMPPAAKPRPQPQATA
jgi:hypothetical protein